jgi:hypothetical protein
MFRSRLGSLSAKEIRSVLIADNETYHLQVQLLELRKVIVIASEVGHGRPVKVKPM